MTQNNRSAPSITKNLFLARLRDGAAQCGLWCSVPNVDIVELFAYSKPDWILVDMEHTSAELSQLANLERAAAAANTPLIVRVPSLSGDHIKRVLDCGVQSIFVPQIKTAADVAEAVSFVQYPPNGKRGVAGTTRASRFGHWGGLKAALADEIALIVQIETVEALQDVENIVATPGISAVFVGPADLSAALGHMDQPNHPDVIAAIEEILAAAKNTKMPVGIFAPDVATARKWADKGFSFVSIGQDTSILLAESISRVAAFKN
ncbi:MAG: aldolase/citrate lyase family protein [Pseudomonadota bacterium]